MLGQIRGGRATRLKGCAVVKYRLTIGASPLILALDTASHRFTQVHGGAVDLAFLTEMSNLSPPIIHPPPSSL